MNDDFIKGYKVDLLKVTKRFGVREDDPHNLRFLSITRLFPQDSYKYIGTGEEADGRVELIVVLAEGDDKAQLEKSPMPSFNQKGAGEILTAGVWRKL